METPELNDQTLASVVGEEVGSAHVSVSDWTITKISSGGESAGIFEVSGSALDGEAALSWRLVLKILQPELSAGEPAGWNNGQRESLAYSSGLLEGLSVGLRAPRCLGIDKPDDGTTWLWLEDVGADAGVSWPITRYGLAAYHLGRFNGSFGAADALPSYPWLSRRWLRGWVEEASPFLDVLRNHQNHPYVAQMYDVDHIFRLWELRHMRLDFLESLPQTLCHLDAYRSNLFSRREATGGEQTVAIDWAFVGHAAYGEELASLVVASVAMGHVEPQRMKELETAVLEGYLDGLHDEGCAANPADVRDAYAASASIRLPLGALRLVLPVLLEPENHQETLEQHGGTPLGELCQRWGAMNHYLQELG